MIRGPSRALLSDRRGVASVEFALWTTLFFLVVLVALDFGIYHIDASRADEGVSAAALRAFGSAGSVDFTGLASDVRALAGDPGLSVSTLCNGVSGACTNLDRACACLTARGRYVAQACSTPCGARRTTSGSTAGYYLTIRATRGYQAMLVPGDLLDGAEISRSATVRLQ